MSVESATAEKPSRPVWCWLGRGLGYGLLGVFLWGACSVAYECIAGEAQVVSHEPVLAFGYPSGRWWWPAAGCGLVVSIFLLAGWRSFTWERGVKALLVLLVPVAMLWGRSLERLELSDTGLRHVTERGDVDVDLPQVPSGTYYMPETESFVLPDQRELRITSELFSDPEVARAFGGWLQQAGIPMRYSQAYKQAWKIRVLQRKVQNLMGGK